MRAKLGLPDKDAPTDTAISEKPGTPEISPLASPTRWKKTTLQNLSPKELLNVSVHELEPCALCLYQLSF